MSTHTIGFYEDLTKIIFELSSNMHLISSAGAFNYKHILLLCVDSRVSLSLLDETFNRAHLCITLAVGGT